MTNIPDQIDDDHTHPDPTHAQPIHPDPTQPETIGTPCEATSFVVIGIGADGWTGLTDSAREQLTSARVIYGSRRQLDLLPTVDADVIAWRSPMSEHLAAVLADAEHPTVHILASGDPMFHGVGATIVRAVGAQRVRVIPTVSSASLACARLGWDLARTRVVSTVSADAGVVIPELTDGAQILVLSRDETTPSTLAGLLTDRGFGWSTLTVLSQLGGPGERVSGGLAHSWTAHPGSHPVDTDPVHIDPLNIVGIECLGPRRGRSPGLPDTEYAHDGQITKSTIRASTVAELRPGGRQLLWDIGSGSGSVAIEWLRTDNRGMAICFEQDAGRSSRIIENAARHGVGGALSVRGRVPDALLDSPDPDAVFIGGGLDADVLALAWSVVLPGGRLVANAVTIETQAVLARWHGRHGGTLRRISIETAEPLGSMTTWRPALPITQWAVDKP